ncbi:hypothetical protein SLEP1_g4800 [Rubroshorea leprosula]|uniref:Reverse transcriptase domain-containing protein n=1 Tax=Rubroshorea leprosula TaxID=152421 RepID=A0AAV5HXN8_9ROSI|nr:hypothetical protein SLEP1_g4800 [Rubroshorea leprosula]
MSKNEIELEHRLDQITVGASKLWVNRPKFRKEEERSSADQKPIEKDHVKPWRSYAKVLKGSHGSEVKLMNQPQPTIGVGSDEYKQNKREGGDKDGIKDLAELASEWLGQWFEEVKPWTPTMVAKERFVWLRCQGFPTHVWGPEFFATIGNVWGKFISLDDSTSKKKQFDIGRLLISTPVMQFISKALNIRVNSEPYLIKVMEEEATNGIFSMQSDHVFKELSDLEDFSSEAWSLNSDVEGACGESVHGGGQPKDSWKEADHETDEDDIERGNEVGGEAEMADDMETRYGKQATDRKIFEIMNVEDKRMSGDGFDTQTSNEYLAEDIGKTQKLLISPQGEMADDIGYVPDSLSLDKEQKQEKVYGPTYQACLGEDENWALEDESWAPNMGLDERNVRYGGKEVAVERETEFNAFEKDPEQRQDKGSLVWDFAMKIGVVDRGNKGEILQMLEDMEKQDKENYRRSAATEIMDWGPKPFRFFDAWLESPEFKDIVTDVWKSIVVGGWNGYRLKKKLKETKKVLKAWSKNMVSEIDLKIQQSIEAIASTDKKGEVLLLSIEDVECEKGRRRRNDIVSIMVGNERLEEVKEIKEGMANHFENLFKEENWQHPTLDGIEFNKISAEEGLVLEAQFNEEEEMWEVLKGDILGFVDDFHKNGKLVRRINSSFIVLVPKVDNPQRIDEFRPISLVGAMYKIIAKLLAHRLSSVLNGIIGENQMAFLGGRQLVDSVVIANETIDDAQKRKKASFVFKLDFEKAYNKVYWEFLNYMMLRLGFGQKWRGWIEECLKIAKVSILLNGSTTRQFKMHKGLKQGDPLYPFLFLIIAKGLNGIISSVVSLGLFEGIEIGHRDMKVSHLQFADDTIMFETALEENIWAAKSITSIFEIVSGLKINFGKSLLLRINVSDEWVNKMSFILNCKQGVLPCKYLGVPIGGKGRSIAMWKPIIESFKKKLASWKSRFISLGGRITLLNSVLSSLPVFTMSIHLLPKGVILLLDKIRRSFLWGGGEGSRKINWVCWENICRGKMEGGFGVKDLRKFNLALLGKWWNRLARGEEDFLYRGKQRTYPKWDTRTMETGCGHCNGGELSSLGKRNRRRSYGAYWRQPNRLRDTRTDGSGSMMVEHTLLGRKSDRVECRHQTGGLSIQNPNTEVVSTPDKRAEHPES